MSIALPTFAWGEAVTGKFNIPSQSLSSALLQFTQRTGIVVVAASDLIRDKVSSRVDGIYADRDVLDVLLDGTGLEAIAGDGGGYVLVQARPRLTAPAQPRTALSAEAPPEVIVTGTRTLGMKPADSLAPIRLIPSAPLTTVGQAGLAQSLARNVPSFTIQAFGRDAANNTPAARLRGLSPNHTLVLVNGKRRHGTSSLSVISGPFQGGAAADLSLIPMSAVKRVEVLTDGAAAQYGTDAVAGVINVILKDSGEGGVAEVAAGRYFDGGGDTAELKLHAGFSTAQAVRVDVSLESSYHGYSHRGAVDPRVRQFTSLSGQADYPYLNRVFGDGAYHLVMAGVNAQSPLGPDWTLYGFGTYSRKKASSYENWRTPDRLPDIYPFGFSPHESILEDDYSASIGVRGNYKDWRIDLTASLGRDSQNFYNYGGANVSLYRDTGATPSRFYVGAFDNIQLTQTLDVTREFDVGADTPLTLAFGLEARRERYAITQGDAASFYKEGAQAFPGFSPNDAGRYIRESRASYLNLSYAPLKALRVDAVVRLEHYSDFGDATVGRLAARYDLLPRFAIRGTLSSGFRAPTLAEEYYSATNVTPQTAHLQLPPNSDAAALLGFQKLRPEVSLHYSLGFVAQPSEAISMTLDAYEINIDRRIVGSGTIYGTGSPDGTNSPAVTAALISQGFLADTSVIRTGINIFTNGADTTTQGVEFVLRWPATYRFGTVEWSLSADYGRTRVTKIRQAPPEIRPQTVLDPAAISNLEDNSPTYRWMLAAFGTRGRWTVSLRQNLYGPSSNVLQSDDYVEGGVTHIGQWYKSDIRAHLITDLEVSYRLAPGLRGVIGANNLFNVYPEKLRDELLHSYRMANDNAAVYQYASWSPFGINGGYYYTRLVFAY